MRYFIIILLFCLAALFPVTSQVGADIIPAVDYLRSISNLYGGINDYQALLSVEQAGGNMEGTMFYKSPNKLLVQFSNPSGHVICLNGETLQVAMPSQRVVLEQPLRNQSAGLASIGAGQGLAYLIRGYSVAYLSSTDFVPLGNGSSELVKKLRLTWRGQQAYRELILSITESGLIRRIEGTTSSNAQVSYTFSNISVNQGIPDSRFDYNPPGSFYTINNFLYDPED